MVKTELVFRNETRYPDREVLRLVRFGFAELELPRRVVVRVVSTRVSRRRRAAGREWTYPASGFALHGAVVLRVSPPELFPAPWYDRRYSVGIGEIADWREALVAIAAHEGKHLEVAHLRQRRRLTSREEEARCDAEAASRLRAYRLRAATQVAPNATATVAGRRDVMSVQEKENGNGKDHARLFREVVAACKKIGGRGAKVVEKAKYNRVADAKGVLVAYVYQPTRDGVRLQIPAESVTYTVAKVTDEESLAAALALVEARHVPAPKPKKEAKDES